MIFSGLVAQEFCATFYEKLIIGNLTVQEAFDAALHMVEIKEEPTAPVTFLLLPESERGAVKRLCFVLCLNVCACKDLPQTCTTCSRTPTSTVHEPPSSPELTTLFLVSIARGL